MRGLAMFAGQELLWVRNKSDKRLYELRSAEEVLATLRRERGRGTLATAQAAGGTWTFKRAGCFHPRVTVRAAGSEADLANLSFGWTGKGFLEFAGGRLYRWTMKGLWKPVFQFQSQEGRTLVSFRASSSAAKGKVTIEEAAAPLPELPLLVLLGWYLLLLAAEDSAAVIATAAAASG